MLSERKARTWENIQNLLVFDSSLLLSTLVFTDRVLLENLVAHYDSAYPSGCPFVLSSGNLILANITVRWSWIMTLKSIPLIAYLWENERRKCTSRRFIYSVGVRHTIMKPRPFALERNGSLASLTILGTVFEYSDTVVHAQPFYDLISYCSVFFLAKDVSKR